MRSVERNNEDQGIFKADAFTRWKIENKILKIPVAPQKVIITPQAKMVLSKKKRFLQKEIKGMMGMHLCMNENKGIYLSGGWGIGGPALVAVCEELYALGTREYYFIGMAGRLSEDVEEGSIWTASSAIREEGTSGHYLPQDYSKEIDNSEPAILKSQMWMNEITGNSTKFISTDAPYRETVEKYNEWRNNGAKQVDMETASLYAFSKFYNTTAVSIGIGADSLFNGKWEMAKNYPVIERSLSAIIDKLIEVIK